MNNLKVAVKLKITDELREKINQGAVRHIKIITHCTGRFSVEAEILEA